MARSNFSTSYNRDLAILVDVAWWPYTNGPYSIPYQTSLETTSGVSRRKPVGFIPPTGYSFFHKDTTNAYGSCISVGSDLPRPDNQSISYFGVVGGPAGRFSTDDRCSQTLAETVIENTSLSNQALISARQNLKGMKVNLGVAFGERNQTARLIGDTATRMAKSFSSLKRGRIREAMRHLGISGQKRQPRGANAPQKWLELQYGWKPLLSDIYGASSALEGREKSDWRVTAKATRSQLIEEDRWFDPTGPGLGRCRASAKCSAFVRIDALPQNEATISLASLGVTNPLSVAWELVPFSFVVDWMIPIGDWLDSLDAMLGYSTAYTSSSLLTKASWKVSGGYYRSGPHSYVRNDYSGGKRIVKLTRSASSGVPLPSLPQIKDPRSLGHMANGLALLATAFGRSTPKR